MLVASAGRSADSVPYRLQAAGWRRRPSRREKSYCSSKMGVVEKPRIGEGATAQGEDTRRFAGAREALINAPESLKAIVKATVQRMLEREVTEHLQAGPHERTGTRSGPPPTWSASTGRHSAERGVAVR